PATQLSKFAAASRIALAVISGWPEAPSSPLQGGAPPGPGVCGCALLPAFGANKLLRKLETPSPELWALAATAEKSAAANAGAPAHPMIDGIRRFIALPARSNIQSSEGPAPVSNSLTKAGLGWRLFRRTTHPPLFPAANRLPTCHWISPALSRPSLLP